MSSFFAVIIFIAINILPSGVSTFEVVAPEGKTNNGKPTEKIIRFEKQEAGGWRAIDLPSDEIGVFNLEGNKRKISPPEEDLESGNGQAISLPMDSMME